MRKLALVLAGAALISSYAIASNKAPSIVSSTILHSLQASSSTQNSNALPLVYGGQDISRSKVATADESLWAGQRTLVG